MTGQPPLDIDLDPLPRHAVVADLVYAPLETPLLAAARARGLATADGLGMLLHQAVRGFQLWFGVRPEVTPQLRALVEADLAGNRGIMPAGRGFYRPGGFDFSKAPAQAGRDFQGGIAMQTMTRRALGLARTLR